MPSVTSSATGGVQITSVVAGPFLAQFPLPRPKAPSAHFERELHTNASNDNARVLQQQQPPPTMQQPQSSGIPTVQINYTVVLASVSLYPATVKSLQNAVTYSSVFSDRLLQSILQIGGSTSPLLRSSQIVTYGAFVTLPLSMQQLPTRKPTSQDMDIVPVNEQTPFDITITVSSSAYVNAKTKKYFLAYVEMFMYFVVILFVFRMLYLLHLRVNTPRSLLSNVAGSKIYDPYEAPPAAETKR